MILNLNIFNQSGVIMRSGGADGLTMVVLSRRTILAGAPGLIAAPALGTVSNRVAGAVQSEIKGGSSAERGKDVTRYNDYGEFGSNKMIWKEAQELNQRLGLSPSRGW